MKAWLDEYAFRTRNNRLRAEPKLWRLDARALMHLYTRESVGHCDDPRLSADHRAGLRLDADLHAFFEERFKFVVSSVRASPLLSRSLRAEMPTGDEIKSFAEHLSGHDFSYLDLPGSAFRIGDDVEVKAVFAKVAKIVDPAVPKAVGLDDEIVIEAIVGLRGAFTRQRLLWRMGQQELAPHVEDPADVLFPRTPDPAQLVISSGTDLARLVHEVETLVTRVFAHARTYEGTVLATPIPTIPDGHSTLSRPHPSVKRGLTPMTSLLAAGEVPPTRGSREGLH